MVRKLFYIFLIPRVINCQFYKRGILECVTERQRKSVRHVTIQNLESVTERQRKSLGNVTILNLECINSFAYACCRDGYWFEQFAYKYPVFRIRIRIPDPRRGESQKDKYNFKNILS